MRMSITAKMSIRARPQGIHQYRHTCRFMVLKERRCVVGRGSHDPEALVTAAIQSCRSLLFFLSTDPLAGLKSQL